MKKKLLFSFCLLVGITLIAKAQTDGATKIVDYAAKDTLSGWKHKGVAGVNFGQTSLTNWSAGGENSVSGDFYLNGSLNYFKNKWSWDNSLALQYGTVYSSENDWRKSADKISFSSVLGYQINSKWSYAFLFDFNSQFAKGYDYPDTEHYISKFLAPAYSNLALGLTYKPNPKYMFFFSPITARMTFVEDDYLSSLGSFGLDPGERFLMQPGLYLMGSTNQTIMQNVNLISKLDIFSPYDDRFGNFDINWDILLSFKINKLLTATLNTTLRYYEKEIEKVQFKEVFGMGFAYNF